MSSSTPDETFRGTIRGCTPDGEPHTVIVTRRGVGSARRVWLTFNGAIKTTVVMTNPETRTPLTSPLITGCLVVGTAQ
jgi:hypothetical protein